MLGLTVETRVFIRTGVTDLRLSFEGLCGLVVNVIKQEPTSGHIFAFCNRGRSRVKCLHWDGRGLPTSPRIMA
ncbi:MAG: transposase [Gammaproteobacteria bacterium]|nr:transposase [Gammaproteobacteria bacterium]